MGEKILYPGHGKPSKQKGKPSGPNRETVIPEVKPTKK
jgi:hypothetical protein